MLADQQRVNRKDVKHRGIGLPLHPLSLLEQPSNGSCMYGRCLDLHVRPKVLQCSIHQLFMSLSMRPCT